jgi:hypothetical protein
MKHTHHTDPFEYSEYQPDNRFDFDWSALLILSVVGAIALGALKALIW